MAQVPQGQQPKGNNNQPTAPLTRVNLGYTLFPKLDAFMSLACVGWVGFWFLYDLIIGWDMSREAGLSAYMDGALIFSLIIAVAIPFWLVGKTLQKENRGARPA